MTHRLVIVVLYLNSDLLCCLIPMDLLYMRRKIDPTSPTAEHCRAFASHLINMNTFFVLIRVCVHYIGRDNALIDLLLKMALSVEWTFV